MLSLPGIREALAGARAPVIAVSPIIAGAAVKGPTDKIMRELGVPTTQDSIACHYQGLLDGYVVDIFQWPTIIVYPKGIYRGRPCLLFKQLFF